MHNYTLLTGATGLLGRYLLRDLLQAGFPVVTLVRGRHRQSAADRIETVVAHWERIMGRHLPRPVVVRGTLDKRGLGLSTHDYEWLRQNCGRVLHCAASLKFVTDQKDQEPWRTNLDGTKHLLEFCRELKTGEFHHISTAYVAGCRTDTAREQELDVGQGWANPYEESKVAAERFVRDCDFIRDLTVYRPSIIVGDSVTGYTSSYHGFYTPLRVSHALAPKLPDPELATLDFLSIFDLEGPEGKNLVPVDWVAAAILKIVSRQELHGQTYHLTSPAPVTVSLMQEVFREVVRPRIALHPVPHTTENLLELAAAMAEQLKVYQSYWRNDPTFDTANTARALPDLPCPVMDRTRLLTLARYAMEHNFRLNEAPLQRAAQSLSEWFAQLSDQTADPSNAAVQRVGLQVTGPGGGDWEIAFNNRKVTSNRPGRPVQGALTFYLSSQTLRQLASHDLQPTQALESGRTVVLGGETLQTTQLADWLGELVPPISVLPDPQPALHPQLKPSRARI